MSWLFLNMIEFNEDISRWRVHNVRDPSEIQQHGSGELNGHDGGTKPQECDEVEEASRILGGLVRENLFKHSLHVCSQNPEEHRECLNRFDSIQGGAVYIFEIGVTGECFPSERG